MEFNTLHSKHNFVASLGIAIAILGCSAIANVPESLASAQRRTFIEIANARIQENYPYISSNTLNGLFTPNASQRFFEAGRDNFKKERDFLNNSEYYLNRNILQINPELLQEIENNQHFFNLEENVDFKLKESQSNY